MKHYLATLQETIANRWDDKALCNYKGDSFTFGELATEIQKFHIFFEQLGLKKGDKVAICAKNTARWATTFLAVTSYETVIVPILSDFHPDSVNNLVDHSDSVVLFTDKEIWDKLDISKMPKIRCVVSNDDYTLFYSDNDESKAAYETRTETFAARYPKGFGASDVAWSTDNLDDLSIINYTSGTTSAPKGVMLTHRNISASVEFGLKYVPVYKGDAICSMLPMAHIYGLVFEFIYPLCGGACINYLGKTPAPSLLLKAMKDVQPYLVLTVPLVMEKVYKSSLKPLLDKPTMKILTAVPGVRRIIFNKMRAGLDQAFGGKVREYIMGGAAVNPEVESCFRKIGLHYTVGYGMTEAAPLLAYEAWDRYAQGSCGKKVDCATVRIDSEDSQNIAGEIQAKGDNICIGYYKNEEATKAAFTDDGFLRTGDLGVIDAQGNIFIRGRSKNMILSANGQNIYPEEIEAIVNTMPFAVESVVIDRGGKIVALVYLDSAAIQKAGLDAEAISEIPENIRKSSNKQLPAYSQIAKVEIVDEPFEKTPKMSIKRFLYQSK